MIGQTKVPAIPNQCCAQTTDLIGNESILAYAYSTRVKNLQTLEVQTVAAYEFDQNPLFEQGVSLRREVLGDTHVQRSLDRAADDALLGPMQQLTTEIGWGTVWSRPGLERKTRSFLSCAFLIALGHHEEFRVHVRGAINNGATQEEIMELLVHAAVYCGFPVALEGTRLAKEVFDQMANEHET